jgi:ATP-binding cassette subfamily B protein
MFPGVLKSGKKMNVVERGIPGPGEAVTAAPVEPATPPPASQDRKIPLRPLISLLPYLARYRWHAIAALCALVIAAITTLVVPIAVRRMIDFGFSRDSVSLIDNYFTVLIVVVGVLALASAARFYLVTMLGERIVADLRSEVFGHLTSLSASYFDQAKTGEAVSRLTADTTQIKAAVGSAVSVALRRAWLSEEPATTLICVVSAVSRLMTSPECVRSKNAGPSWAMCWKMSERRSATTRSPSQLT